MQDQQNVSNEWDAFPEDDDDDDNGEQDVDIFAKAEHSPSAHNSGSLRRNDDNDVNNGKAKLRTAATAAAALYLTQHFCKTFHVPLPTCRVGAARVGHTKQQQGTENVDVFDDDNDNVAWLSCWNKALTQRGIQRMHLLALGNEEIPKNEDLFDVFILIADNVNSVTMADVHESRISRYYLVPGGLVFLITVETPTTISMPSNHWSAPTEVFTKQLSVTTAIRQSDSSVNGSSSSSSSKSITLVAWSKLLCPINSESCRRWLPSKHSLSTEQAQLHQATVTPSATQCLLHRRLISEQQQQEQQPPQQQHRLLSPTQHQKAVTALASCGYCILRKLLDPTHCEQYGQAVLQDLQLANSILQDKYQVDVYQPQTNPDSYRELSMREDLRMDLRDGPQLRKQQQVWSNNSSNDSNINTPYSGHLFWQQPDLVHIVKSVMYPWNDEFKNGNFGRFNFDGIAEEDVEAKGIRDGKNNNNNNDNDDESCPPLKLSSVGGIISLPGAADQAVHADTPHLFEHENCLPAHYINAFTPGCYHDDPRVGGTAFIHGSHQLSFTAKYTPTTTTTSTRSTTTATATATTTAEVLKQEMYAKYLVRPWLQPGDVLLFDCRILHFGLANLGVEPRPMIYTNITHSWFHDPKNWDDRQAIFDPQLHFSLS